MSAQTGNPAVVPPAPSSRLERARIGLQRMRSDPNPVWFRELRQSARLTRTPIILAVVTSMMTLLVASVGGIASVTADPARVGVALYQTFFSVAFFVVTWVAPAVAATSISSERGGRTWEALLLTGLGIQVIARGKFMASLTYIGMYIIMLAPVGALPFLFGGVTAIEVFTGFALLTLFAAISVAFGLSVSSAFNNPATAIVVTLLVAIPLSLLAYLGLGLGLSFAASVQWPSLPDWGPVWLPTAYARADFSVEYLVYLVLSPLFGALIPAWFFYEITIANMASASDDRSTRLRYWMLVSIPLSAIASVGIASLVDSSWAVLWLGVGTFAVLLVVVVFVLAGEPLGPSRRIRVHWERRRVGPLRRYLGPGILRASTLVMVLGVLGMLTQAGVGIVWEMADGGSHSERNITCLLSVGTYLAGFHVFVVGFTAFCRARVRSGSTARVLLLGALFLILVGPWIVMSIGGVVTNGGGATVVLASPSPTYAYVVISDWAGTSLPGKELIIAAGFVCALGWGVLGLGLLASAGLRTRRLIEEHHAALAEVEQMLIDEDTAVGDADSLDSAQTIRTDNSSDGEHGDPGSSAPHSADSVALARGAEADPARPTGGGNEGADAGNPEE